MKATEEGMRRDDVLQQMLSDHTIHSINCGEEINDLIVVIDVRLLIFDLQLPPPVSLCWTVVRLVWKNKKTDDYFALMEWNCLICYWSVCSNSWFEWCEKIQQLILSSRLIIWLPHQSKDSNLFWLWVLRLLLKVINTTMKLSEKISGLGWSPNVSRS